MGKKKRLTNSVEDDHMFEICPHMEQAASVTKIKQSLLNVSDKTAKCQECPLDQKVCVIYICLKCGYQGCDRRSPLQHALMHHQSTEHPCAVSANDLKIWCYLCDNFRNCDPKKYSDAKTCLNFLSHTFGATEQKKNGPASRNSKKANEENSRTAVAPSSSNVESPHTVKGLTNIGNTCFFNSIMQVVNQTHLFRRLLVKKGENSKSELRILVDDDDDDGGECIENSNCLKLQKETSLTVDVETSYGMGRELLNFFEQMRTPCQKTPHNPKSIFGHVCQKFPQFRGFQQHDSHELLRHLLEGLQEEEAETSSKGLKEIFTGPVESLPDYKRRLVEEYGKAAKHTTTDKVFGGCFISNVTCLECKRPSHTYEPFLDVSISLQNDKSHVVDETEETIGTSTGKMYRKSTAEESRPSKHAMKKEKKAAKKLKKQSKKNASVLSMKGDLLNGSEGEEKITDTNNDADENEGEQDDSEQGLEVNMGSMNLKGGHDGQEGTALDGSAPDESCSDERLSRCDAIDSSGPHCDETLDDKQGATSEHDAQEGVEANDQKEEELRAESASDFTEDLPGRPAPQETMLAAMKKAMTPLSTGERPAPEECSIASSLYQHTDLELLSGSNKYLCEYCNQGSKDEGNYTIAMKQVLVYAPPAILTLHMKRFQQGRASLKKLNKHVAFSEILDLAPFCSSLAENVAVGQSKVLYELYGMVEHSGSMTGGHYVAYVKVRDEAEDSEKFVERLHHGCFSAERLVQTMLSRETQQNRYLDRENNNEGAAPRPGKWFYVSDNHVRHLKDFSNVSGCQAYLLFYERIL